MAERTAVASESRVICRPMPARPREEGCRTAGRAPGSASAPKPRRPLTATPQPAEPPPHPFTASRLPPPRRAPSQHPPGPRNRPSKPPGIAANPHRNPARTQSDPRSSPAAPCPISNLVFDSPWSYGLPPQISRLSSAHSLGTAKLSQAVSTGTLGSGHPRSSEGCGFVDERSPQGVDRLSVHTLCVTLSTARPTGWGRLSPAGASFSTSLSTVRQLHGPGHCVE